MEDFEEICQILFRCDEAVLVVGPRGVGKTSLAEYLRNNCNEQAVIIDDITEDRCDEIVNNVDRGKRVICFSRYPILPHIFKAIYYGFFYVGYPVNYNSPLKWGEIEQHPIDMTQKIEKQLKNVDDNLNLSKYQEDVIEAIHMNEKRYLVDFNNLSINNLCDKGLLEYTSLISVNFASVSAFNKYFYEKNVVGKGFAQNEFTIASIPQIMATIKDISNIFEHPKDLYMAFYKHIGERYGMCLVSCSYYSSLSFIIPGLIIIEFSKYIYQSHRARNFREASHVICIKNRRNLDQVTVDSLASTTAARRTIIYTAKGSDKIVAVTNNRKEVL